MSWQTLRPQVKTLLESAQSDSVAILQEVSLAPMLKFNGYPAAYVVHSDNIAEYETTNENIRTYAFIIRIFQETKRKTVMEGLDSLERAVDAVLDLFDQEDQKGDDTRIVGINLPSGYTFLNILAHPSEWGEVQGESLLMAEIRVQIRISRDLT